MPKKYGKQDSYSPDPYTYCITTSCACKKYDMYRDLDYNHLVSHTFYITTLF